MGKLSDIIFGKRRDPFDPSIFKNIALVALLAWVGLGADGLSSACYGPEQAFLVLGRQHHLALYLAVLTAITVFIISIGYNQVIELFPSGGGGYRVATKLLGRYIGLISGVALLIDYMLTIAISIASGTDAVFSLLHTQLPFVKQFIEIMMVGLLVIFNLRGMKESIMLLLPIFIGFVVLHVGLIIYGIVLHEQGFIPMIHATVHETSSVAKIYGWSVVVALVAHAYSLGGGTYTGLEAVSNNVNKLAEPRVRTGKITMLYMAFSLSFTAAGIILLYLLWGAQPEVGKTLNAVVFGSILGPSMLGHTILIATLFFEAGILFVAANTGFLGGPAVLANMSVDRWVPKRFQHLSSRLVTQNGVILLGVSALLILIWTKGSVTKLVIFYSISVFLTFTITLFGLVVYWAKRRSKGSRYWYFRLLLSLLGFFITASILTITFISKFFDYGIEVVLLLGVALVICSIIHYHYTNVHKKLRQLTSVLAPALSDEEYKVVTIDPKKPTAAFFIATEKSLSMHTLLWALRMFPKHFYNLVFISVGEVDIKSFRGEEELATMREQVEKNLAYFVKYAQQHGFAAESYEAYGANVVDQLIKLSDEISEKYSEVIYFSSQLIFEKDNWALRVLHNETPIALQRRLHAHGRQLVILPMKI